jgi:hypothetical protein
MEEMETAVRGGGKMSRRACAYGENGEKRKWPQGGPDPGASVKR